MFSKAVRAAIVCLCGLGAVAACGHVVELDAEGDDLPDAGPDGGEESSEIPTGVCWATLARAGDEPNGSGDFEVLAADAYADGGSVVVGRFHTSGDAVFGPGEPNETIVAVGDETGFVARYNPDGALDWARGMDGDVQRVAAAPDGDAIVSGWFAVPEVGPGLFALARVGEGAAVAWAQSGSEAPAVAVAGDGSVMAAGGNDGPVVLDCGGPDEIEIGGTESYVTWVARFTADGALAWAQQTNEAGLIGSSHSMALQDDGRFAISGNNGYALVVAAFDEDGASLWTRHASTSAGYAVESKALALDDGSYAVGGIHWRGLTFTDGADEPTTLSAPVEGDPPHIEAGAFFLGRYSEDGDLLWVTSADNPDVNNCAAAWAQSFATMPGDGILVSGFLNGEVTFGLGEPQETSLVGTPLLTGPATHAFVARYATSGELDWAMAIAPGADMFEVGAAAASTDGSMFISGSVEGSAEFDLSAGGTTTIDALGDDDLFLIELCP
jgi:hypothetical protein